MDRNSYEAHPYDPQQVFRDERDTLSQPAFDTVSFPSQQSWHAPAPEASPWDLDEELAHMLSGATRAAAAAPSPVPNAGPASAERSSHRKISRRRPPAESHLLDGGQRITHVTVLIASIGVAAVSLLTWAISYSYGQLHTIAETVLPANLAQWWPLTVYGPWFVAALSILRATVQRRSAHRSWGVILTASGVAVALCVSHASQAILTFVMLGIPPITALVCFWELVGQVSSKYRSPARQGAHAQRNSKR